MNKTNKKLGSTWLAGTLRSRYIQELKDQIEGLETEEETTAIDELQLDPMIDYYTDQLFAWLTVLMSEPKYIFMAPAVVQAIIFRLKSQKAEQWGEERISSQAQKYIKYLEALICDGFCRDRADTIGVIGSRIWRGLTDKGIERISPALIASRGGIQKTLGMHPTPRYLARAGVIFTGERHRVSALDTIVDGVKNVSRDPWWISTPKVAPIVRDYTEEFLNLLTLAKPRPAKRSLALDLAERKTLQDGLFGVEEKRRPWQRFLVHAQHRLGNADDYTPSQFLLSLLPGLDSDLVQQVKTAAVICEAVGIVRFIYDSKLAARETDALVARKIKRLAKLNLPRSLPADVSSLSSTGLVFLKKCQAMAGRRDSLNSVMREIAQRESEVKGERAKIYVVKSGRVLITRGEQWSDEAIEKLKYNEPPMRIKNARSMLRRLSPLRRVD